MRECQRRGIPTTVDLDDDLWAIPRTNPAKGFWERRDIRRDLEAQLDLADRVTTSTVPLAQAVATHLGWKRWQDRISICPNHLRTDYWGDAALCPVTPYSNYPHTVIGWQGSTTHETDFSAAAGALAEIVKRYPQVMLRFFGILPELVRQTVPPNRRQVVKGVKFEKYPATLKFVSFDIGIAPLTPCQFNAAKSNLKWLEYASLRVPCVASKVYPYAKSIDHGRTGFLAETQAEWEEHLSALVEDIDLRRRVGEAANREVWASYSEEAKGPAWVETFKALCGKETPHDSADSSVRLAGRA